MMGRRRRLLTPFGRGVLAAAAVVGTMAIAGSLSLVFGAALPAPDGRLTPGVVRTDLTEAQIKATKWGKDERVVTSKMIGAVAKRDGIRITPTDKRGVHDPSCGSPRCEIDHRIPRECGGADDPDNLWYQAAPYWHRKDRLENWAHAQMLAGKLSLAGCQAVFKADWRLKYREVFGIDAEHDPP